MIAAISIALYGLVVRAILRFFRYCSYAATGLAAFLLVAEPARAQITVAGSFIQERAAKPGELYRSSVTIRNDAEAPAEVVFSLRDIYTTADGSFAFGPAASGARSNCRWIQLSAERGVVPAKSSAAVDIVVRVPPDAGKGTFWGCVVIAEAPRALPGAEGVGVNVVTEYVVQVVTHVGEPRRTLELGAALFKDGKVLLEVSNPGDFSVRPKLWVEVRDEAGELVGRYLGEERTVYPGNATRFEADLSKLGPGSYHGRAFLDAGRRGELWRKDFSFSR